MQIPIRQLTPELAVAPQLSPEDMAAAAAAGFRGVLNNRPDGEAGPDQPTSADIQAAAEAAGLRYIHLPMPSSGHTPEQAQAFAQALAALPRPVLAFCRTGNRSTSLFSLARALGLLA